MDVGYSVAVCYIDCSSSSYKFMSDNFPKIILIRVGDLVVFHNFHLFHKKSIYTHLALDQIILFYIPS